ncbi:gamma-butyrobetaine hydroxylase-like domain-containing protein [Beggiatoa leptomitoformis]|uniref:DUF971 domain-containing protein n=1 Tax=Beggiatoa leptomitoformis TaxID=288004 RepID=A0A2N9YDI2_9GAMM|nr:DUF971 domain-containing protein [Beggiatoa leptomitoformis]ALG69066.1 DUF971 domain-containing protein [Beggiatoa leptomitoformis]AUI68524.2 DUF971 domain-containing protein [Beggiatoa leptomitoformis]
MPIPTDIKLHQKSKHLEITFESGEHFDFTCEFLRVFSPSAEVRGHTEAQAVLQVEKAAVNIEKIEPVGTYAVILFFDDGHNTGIYSWDWLYHLGINQSSLWTTYLAALEKAGKSRFAVTLKH